MNMVDIKALETRQLTALKKAPEWLELRAFADTLRPAMNQALAEGRGDDFAALTRCRTVLLRAADRVARQIVMGDAA